jgi:hypothetical protein
MILIINNYLIRKINYSILNRNLSFFYARYVIYIYIYSNKFQICIFVKEIRFLRISVCCNAGSINILLVDLLIKFIDLEYCHANII